MYNEFENISNNSTCVKVTPVLLMKSLYRISKIMNDGNEIEHQLVNFLYEKYSYHKKNVKYKDVCVYVLYNPDTFYFYIGSGSEYARRYTHFKYLEDNKLHITGIDSADKKIRKHYNYKLQKAYNANSNFIFYKIDTLNRKEALAVEQKLLDIYYGSYYCLNLARYVEVPSLGIKFTKERCDKISTSSINNWQNPIYRAKMNKMFSSPEFSKRMSTVNTGNTYAVGNILTDKHKQLLSENSTLYWESLTEEEKKDRIKKLNAGKTLAMEDPIYRERVLATIKIAINQPEAIKKKSIASSKYSNRPEVKEARTEFMKSQWEDPKYREKLLEVLESIAKDTELVAKRTIKLKETLKDPIVREAKSNSAKERFKDNEFREKNNLMLLNNNIRVSKKISINGIEYISKRNASRVLKINRGTLNSKLLDPNNLNYIYLN